MYLPSSFQDLMKLLRNSSSPGVSSKSSIPPGARGFVVPSICGNRISTFYREHRNMASLIWGMVASKRAGRISEERFS